MTIQELFRNLGVEFIEQGNHTRPGWINIDCVYCGPNSKKFHLGYNIRSGHFNCWKCRGHNALDVLYRLGLKKEAAEEFLNCVKHEWKPPERIRKGLKEPRCREPLHRAHVEYLRSRGFNPFQLERIWSIEGIALAHRLKWRIYIPIIHRETRVSWTTRAIGDRVAQRYVSASAEEEVINHKHLIYGRDMCQHSIIVVEGPTDAWAVGPGAGALFGLSYSAQQVHALVRIPLRIVCFDNEPEAQRRAQELCHMLSLFPGTTHNVVLDAADPGSAYPRDIRKLRKLACL